MWKPQQPRGELGIEATAPKTGLSIKSKSAEHKNDSIIENLYLEPKKRLMESGGTIKFQTFMFDLYLEPLCGTF